MYNIYILFIIALLLFSIYFIIITIFGYSIFTLFYKDYLKKKISLTSILKSFAIGLSLQICYAMIIVSLRIFNFFTAYLPFIIFDAIFLMYIYFRTDVIKNKVKNINKNAILDYLKKNNAYIFVLIIALIMQYLLQLSFVAKSIAISGKDAYFWFAHTWFTHENGYLKFHKTNIRPPGYILFYASITSITDDFYIFYFYFKYGPLFLMSINLLVIFVISKKIFKKKIDVFFTLAIFLSFNYLFYRYHMALPSILATTFGFLLLLFLNKSIVADIKSNNFKLKISTKRKFTDKNLIFKGILFAGIFMSHGLYFSYYIFFYLSFELLLLIINLVQNRRVVKENLKLLFKFFIVIFSLFLYIIIFSLPAFICVSSYSTIGTRSLFNYFFYYFPSLEPGNLIIKKKLILLFLTNLMEFLKQVGYWLIYTPIHDIINCFFKDILFELPFLKIFREVYTLTLGLAIFFVVFGVFIKYRKNFNFNEKQNYLVNFFRFIFLFVILMLIVIYLMEMIKIPIFQELTSFLNKYFKRIFELFVGFWAIIFTLSVNYIFKLIKKLYFKIKNTSKVPSKRLVYVFKIAQLVTIILLGGVLYVSNFERIYYGTRHDTKRAEALLYIGNYFNENPLDEKTRILLEYLEETNTPYYTIERKNLERKLYNFTEDEDYDDFKDYFNEKDCEYVLLPKYLLDENYEFMEDFEKDFDKIYENSKFIFAEID